MSISPETQLSDYYQVKDLSTTSTGFPNLPTETELPNLKKLASSLDILRRKLGNFAIASGYRSPVVNAAVGGASTSRHLFGDAVDIVPYTMTTEKYWAEILADSDLRKLFGEISYKKPQNAIHLSLPFKNSLGVQVIGSARVADGSPLVYVSQTPSQVNTYLSKYGLAQASLPIQANIIGGVQKVLSVANQSYFGKAMLVLGGGVLLLSITRKLKNG